MQKAFNKQHEMQGPFAGVESMEADFSGFYSGVKEVLVAKKSGKLAGINGAVAELISVENNYVKAVETALGGAMQHIVTSTEGDARKAIAYLKAKNAGRATFLTARCHEIEENSNQLYLNSWNSILNSLGTADRLVQTERTYTNYY